MGAHSTEYRPGTPMVRPGRGRRGPVRRLILFCHMFQRCGRGRLCTCPGCRQRGTALALSGAGIRRASNTRCVGARRVRKRKRWTSTHARRRQWGTIVVLQIARALACCANDRGWRRLHSLIQWRCIRFAARGRGIISGLVQADEFLATHTAHH